MVYRTDPDQNISAPIPPTADIDENTRETKWFTATTLPQYSTLTINGHRIHYDSEYSETVEAYNGLVVHGPLWAEKLALLDERLLGRLTQFAFRATAPLVHTEEATFCWRDGIAWVRGPDGRQCMIATARN